MNFGITGASGVLGTILCEKLKKLNINFSKFNEDLRDKNAIQNWIQNNNFDRIIHFAAIVSTKEVNENPILAYDVNVSGTINLLSALNQVNKGKKIWFFYASTSHVYKSSDKPLTEMDEIKPISLYGKTKFMAEQVVYEIGNLQKDNIDTCIGRIFSFYHKSQKPPFLYPNILRRLKEENLDKEFFLYGADSIRDFLDAEDVIEIIIKLALKKSKGIYNIASGKPIKIRDFVQSLTEKKLNIVTTTEKNILVANISKLQNELNTY